MADDRFERDLEAVLRNRDPGAAPAGLLDLVGAIPDRNPGGLSSRLRRRLSSAAQMAAAAIAVVVLAALVLIYQSSVVPPEIRSGVGATPSPAAMAFDPTAEGAGVYSASIGMETLAIFLIVPVLLILGIVIVRRPIIQRVALAAAIAILAGVLWIENTAALESTGMIWYPGLGAVTEDPPADGTSTEDQLPTQRYLVGPDGILTFGFDIHNRGPVPITVLGVIPSPRYEAWGRVVAAGWMGGQDGVSTVEPERFAPKTLAPGGFQVLMVAGRASSCSIARDTEGDVGAASAGFEQVLIAYEALGIHKSVTLQLPRTIRLSIDPGCQPREFSSPLP